MDKITKTVAKLTQSIQAAFENGLVFVYESRGVYFVARQRDSEHPGVVRTLRAIGTTSQKLPELKKQIKEYADETETD